ncbi:MAG TPA: serine/threonine-protein kinase, partial [Planctomycetota bacterium]|nr:serine/threonine-protein kinase [Planctomycetota bacterium]
AASGPGAAIGAATGPGAAGPVGTGSISQTPAGPLSGSAREFVAVALRDRVISKAEIDAALAAAPPDARQDSRALADALVGARVLARPQAELIEACLRLERDAPSLEVEGFYLVAPLGFSPFGPVITARRTTAARPGETPELALEIMPPVLTADARRVDEFRRRCGYLPQAEHPALARAVDTGMSGGSLFVARESPAGMTLADRLAKKPLPERDALDLARAVVDALGALAFVQMPHGAVRPENILLTPEGRWILRYVGHTPAPAEWDPESTPPCADLPRWLSPEAITGAPIDARADMYSLGIVLFAAVTGRPPYDGATSAPIIAAHLAGQLPDPAASGVPVSPRFLGVLKVLTSPSPAGRYSDYLHLLEELESARSGGGPGAGDPDSTLLYGGGGAKSDDNDQTMLGSAEEDADLKRMREEARRRREQLAAKNAGLTPSEAGTLVTPAPGQGGDALVGQVLSGRYRLLKKLGAGGMGTVYLAEHLLLHKNVALKILHPKLLENQEAVARFDREVKASSRFQHPGVVQIFDAGEDMAANGAKLHYMVMEFVEGEDLHKIIEREGALPLPRAMNLVRQVLPAIDEAHKKGIVHRDMKSDNIMVCRGPDGVELAKIMDFGIAKIVEGQEGAGGGTGLHDQQQFKTRKGVVTGTPQYMSPEQASGYADIDGRTDLYSFGVIVYEMCLGELPFKSNTAMGYLGKHIVEPPTPVKQTRPDIDLGADLERVIMKCLEKPRESRYQTAAEILKDLEETVFPDILGTPGGKKRRGGAGKKAATLLIAWLAVLALVIGAWLGWRWLAGRKGGARAAAIGAAGEALGKGDWKSAATLLDSLGGDGDDKAVKALRQRIDAAQAEEKELARQKDLVAQGELALAGGKLSVAREKLSEAQKIRADDAVRRAFGRLERREREEEARKVEEEGDRLLASGDPEGALAKLEQAGRVAPRAELDGKIAKARALVLRKEAEARRGAADDKGAAARYREALRLLPLDDKDAIEMRGRLTEILSGYRDGLDAAARKAYLDELEAAGRAAAGRRDYRAEALAYRDAPLFADEGAQAEVLKLKIDSEARAEEQ